MLDPWDRTESTVSEQSDLPGPVVEHISLSSTDAAEETKSVLIERNSRPWLGFAAIALVALGLVWLFQGRDAEPEASLDESLPTTTLGVDASAVADEARIESLANIAAAAPTAAEYLVFYRSDESLAMVDLRDGSNELLDWEAPVELYTDDYVYLASERGSWVVDLTNVMTPLRLAPNAQIAVLEDPTLTAALSTTLNGEQFLVGGFGNGRSLHVLASVPEGADVDLVQGLGAVISPISGGSFIVQSGPPELVTDGRVIGANVSWYIDVTCDDAITCASALKSWDATDVAIELPLALSLADRVAVSPDGRWVVSGPDPGWSLFDVATGEEHVLDVEVSPTASIRWSPDGSFLLWFEQDAVHLLDPVDRSTVATLDLSQRPLQGLAADEVVFVEVSELRQG